MKPYLVKFTDVGRDKKTWEQEFDKLTYASLIRSVRARSALLSSNVEFDLESQQIIVGGFRVVGKIELLRQPSRSQTEEKALTE